MGEVESKLGEPGAESPKKTPLDLAVKHFKHYFDTKICSIPVLKEKCENHWVLLCPEHVWWPKEGMLFPGAIHRLCKFLKANQDGRCLPDDLIYAEGWLRLSENLRHTVKLKLLEWDTRRAIKQMVKTKKAPCKHPAEGMAMEQLAEEQSESSNMLFSISPDQTDEQQLKEAWLELSRNVPQAPCEQSLPFASQAAESSKDSPCELLPPSPRGKEEKVLNNTKQPAQPPFSPLSMRNEGGREEKVFDLEGNLTPCILLSKSLPEADQSLVAEKTFELRPRLAKEEDFLEGKEFRCLTKKNKRQPTPPPFLSTEGREREKEQQKQQEGQRDIGDRLRSCEARSQAPCPPPRTRRRKECQKEEAVKGCRQKQEEGQGEEVQQIQLEVEMKEESKAASQQEQAAAGGRQEQEQTSPKKGRPRDYDVSAQRLTPIRDRQQQSDVSQSQTLPNTDFPGRKKGVRDSEVAKQRLSPGHSGISSLVQLDLESSGILPEHEAHSRQKRTKQEIPNETGESRQAETVDVSYTTALQGSQAKKVMEEEKPLAAETQAQTQSDFSQLSFENISQKDQLNSQPMPPSNQSNRDINTAAKNEIFIVLTEVCQKFQNPQFREILSGFLPLEQNNEIKAESPISPANHDERLIDNPASECSQQPKLSGETTALQSTLSHVKKVADQEKLPAIGTEANILNPELTKVDSQLNPICQRESQGRESTQPTQQNSSNERNVSNSLICPSRDQSLPERHCQYVDKERPDLPLQWRSECHAEAKLEKEMVSLPPAAPRETQGDVSPVQFREDQSVPVSHSCHQPEEQSVPESHDCYQTEDPSAPVTPPLTPKPVLEIEVGGTLIRGLVDSGAPRSVLIQPIGHKSGKSVNIIGASGTPTTGTLLKPQTVRIGTKVIKHEFLFLPDCPIPLIGRDLLYKMQATISFEKSGQASLVQAEANPVNLTAESIQEFQKCYSPQIQPMLASLHVSPAIKELADTTESVYTPLKDGVSLVSLSLTSISVPQYAAIQVHLDGLLNTEAVPDWNTPLLTAEEPRIQDKCQPVQNLQAISEITADMTADADPHVLVGIIIKGGLWYLVLLQPGAEKEFCMFLGMIGHGRIWILDFAALTKPLYGNLKDELPEQASLTWEPEEKALSSEPTLRTPNIAKTLSPVQLQKNSREHSEASPIACLSKTKP